MANYRIYSIKTLLFSSVRKINLTQSSLMCIKNKSIWKLDFLKKSKNTLKCMKNLGFDKSKVWTRTSVAKSSSKFDLPSWSFISIRAKNDQQQK